MPPTLRTFSSTPLALAAGALLLASAARADVRYTTQMQFGGPPDAQTTGVPAGVTMPGLRTTTYVKDMRERVETAMSMGPFQMNQVELTLCDKHQTIRMDGALKIYTVAPIGVASFGPPSGAGKGGAAMPMGEAVPGGKPGVGHVTMTFTIADLGAEKVADLDARHYKIGMRTQTTGCLGDGDRTMQMEEWIAPVKAGLVCPERYSPMRTVPNTNGCQITYEMKGNWDKMRDLHGGMVVRQKMYSGDKMVATTDMREYSQATLDDSLFSPPADYKEVSQADFDKAEADAMRKRLMGGLGQAMGDAASGAATDAANGAAAAAGDAAGNAAANAGDAANNATDAAVDKAAEESKKKKPKIKIPRFPF